ncbi:MAG: hypothetical protein P8M18_01445 [Woeseiaceae bacterium]|nr:hypothetical protein [Woeseiaceae bacterium]
MTLFSMKGSAKVATQLASASSDEYPLVAWFLQLKFESAGISVIGGGDVEKITAILRFGCRLAPVHPRAYLILGIV